jgi:hypothetical protein
MSDIDDNERIIMIIAEPANGDGYVFATADPRRAIDQLKEWSARFGADRVRCNEGFEELARPFMKGSANLK